MQVWTTTYGYSVKAMFGLSRDGVNDILKMERTQAKSVHEKNNATIVRHLELSDFGDGDNYDNLVVRGLLIGVKDDGSEKNEEDCLTEIQQKINKIGSFDVS